MYVHVKLMERQPYMAIAFNDIFFKNVSINSMTMTTVASQYKTWITLHCICRVYMILIKFQEEKNMKNLG